MLVWIFRDLREAAGDGEPNAQSDNELEGRPEAEWYIHGWWD
jgi:hypothetical protein